LSTGLYNVPSSARSLSEAVPKLEQLPDGSRQEMTDFDKIGYGGPCPPGKSPHRYVFSLYAVDTKLPLPASTTRKQLEKALRGHVLARGEGVINANPLQIDASFFSNARPQPGRNASPKLHKGFNSR
jgi:Raf kinase inhibitor-like YbhB/YbcL family protein